MPPKRRIRSIGNLQRSIKRAFSTKRNTARSKKPHRRSRKSIKSTAGDILHRDILPHIDVRSKADIPELMKRIVKGPITIVLVYADWCGHCHTFKPTFNKAIQNKKNSSQVASINETMIADVNKAIQQHNPNATPIKVNGYPSIESLHSEYGSMKNIPQDSLEETLINAGNLAKESISPNFNNYMATPEPSVGQNTPNQNMLNYSSNNIVSPNQNALNQNASNQNALNQNAPMTSNVSEYTPSLQPLESIKIPKYIGGSLYKKMAESMKPLLFHTVTHRRSHRRSHHKK